MNDKVRRLIFFMLGARMIKVGELIESKLAIAFRRAEQMSFVAAVRGQLGKLLHVLMAGRAKVSIAQPPAACELLNSSVEQTRKESILESLMKVADFPKLLFDPA